MCPSDTWQSLSVNTYTYTLTHDTLPPDHHQEDLSSTAPTIATPTQEDAVIAKLYQLHLELSQRQYANAHHAEAIKEAILHQLDHAIAKGESLRSCDLAFIRSACKIEL